MTILKGIVTVFGSIIMLGVGIIAYFTAKTYDKVDTMYEYTIRHPEEHARLLDTMKRDNIDLWKEFNKINKYLADRDTHFYYLPKQIK